MPTCSRQGLQTPTFHSLCKAFAMQSTAHGLKKVAAARSMYTRIFWVLVFVLALIACIFHCSFLVQSYLKYPRMTITEEIHADEITFPSLTVCNLNVLKKSYIDGEMDLPDEASKNSNFSLIEYLDTKPICYKSIHEFLARSKAWDLSDIWMSLTITRDSLFKYGHQADDFLVHCSYNARNCFNQSHSIVLVTQYPSPRYGLCHTIAINQTSLQNVTQPGLPLGLRLTLNIERNDYLDLLSPEYGARLLVHPPGTYPTLQRGGVVLQPGTKTYLSVRMRKIDRLPWPYGDCTKEFDNSPLSGYLRRTSQSDLLKHRIYTYEYCQTLCRDAYLLKQCGCSEEITQRDSRYCDPCNVTQASCRTTFLRRFNRSHKAQDCNVLCKPACTDTRYDLTVSRSEWPNKNHQWYLLKRWPVLREKFGDEVMNESIFRADKPVYMDIQHIKKNFVRVHVFIQEMNYLSVKDVPAYAISELFADLGGCLGLYIGVSLITILEVFELFKSIVFMIQHKFKMRIEPSKPTVKGSKNLYWGTTGPPKKRCKILFRKDSIKCDMPRCRSNIRRGSQRADLNSVHLDLRCISPSRQLPSPIFSQNFANEF